ncbi:sensor histidine kinase [Terrabacter sp. C0L_2]|uniref:sensor histidine kinase n=1 Tax=Terrabacter sp. C0L_2 TaxID=3108389 RepID=UPI002ED40BB5|nr:HAMP domain-containing sensor histidine kinase [Terrabacter sp. C0L_2]
MNRLSARLVLSHLLVALIGAVATFVIVRQLAPTLFDSSMSRSGAGVGMGLGRAGEASLRTQFADSVDQALLVGAILGSVAAASFGAVAAWRLLRPLGAMARAARRMAGGDYATVVEVPRETELAELATDLNRLGAELSGTEARRVRLLGELAHEMRTPLTVIDGYVEGMIDGVLPPGPTSLGSVSDEVRRLRRLADDLSALSRAEEGRLDVTVQPVDLGTLVRRATERMRPQAQDAEIDLQVLPGERVEALVDPDRFSQVVTNLVGNAIRATAPGGRITVTCTRRGEQALVQVADTGEGLDAADLERVFERFYRVPGRRSVGAESGSGIGLTVARGIVRAHGGELTASSGGRGRGATFTATVPLLTATASVPTASAPGTDR